MEKSLSDREINEAVARKLGYALDPYDGNKTKEYCHSIEAAWEIVECDLLKGRKFYVEFEDRDGQWHCALQGPEEGTFGHGFTAPMAICLAFLKLEEK